MKIKKAVKLYSISIPDAKSSSGFFGSYDTSKLYFKSQDEAKLYQELHYPNLRVSSEKIIVIHDEGNNGKDRWVSLNLVEDMQCSNVNKANRPNDYYAMHVNYLATPHLEEIIKSNPSSVIAVKVVDTHHWETDSGSGFGGPHGTKYTYECSDIVDSATSFLYVDDKGGRWFVERGHEIDVTNANDLVLRQQLDKNKSAVANLLAEQAILERQIHGYNSARPCF